MTAFFQQIKAAGGRMTKIRQAILEILWKNECLLSNARIAEKLRRKKIYPNRSTLFRELVFLTKNKIIRKDVIAGANYYEIRQDHHHHLICLNCNDIIKVKLGHHLKRHEMFLARQNNFKITGHLLNFYGYCKKCQI
ncbi:MAG: transcriptional repressor [bacterium]|nr:transcriptional repressor [bacterium]